MSRCQAGPARCHIECAGGCGCIYWHDEDRCECECYEDTGGGSKGKYGLGIIVSVSFAGLPLGKVAARLDRLLAREVLVPASRADRKVNLRLKRTSFSTVIRALGLTTRPAVRTSRGSKR